MQIPDTRATLIARLHDANDATAWVEFCAIYEPTTYRIARQFGLQDADAREVTQNVLVTVSRKIHLFDTGQKGRFRAWLATIAKHAAIDLIRQRTLTAVGGTDFMRKASEVPDNEIQQGFDIEARRQQFLWAAEQVRRQVHETTWSAFWMTAVDGRTGEWVAEHLGMSVGSVYVARCRTLAKIKDLLEPFREVDA